MAVKIGISKLEADLGQAFFVHGEFSMSFKTFQCILVVNQLCFCCIEICEVLNNFFDNKTYGIEIFSTSSSWCSVHLFSTTSVLTVKWFVSMFHLKTET